MPLLDIPGQSRISTALLRSLKHERLHHAYLFAGPEGVGKGAFAEAFAQAILCQTPTEASDACGHCNICHRIRSGQHADVHRVQRELNRDGQPERSIKIGQIRALQQALSFKTFEGSQRVVLVFEAEKMNQNTANAMLKTLEEPGTGTHFVLVSNHAHRLLPTVLSRCQRLDFAPLTIEYVADQLVIRFEVLLEHGRVIAGLSQGSMNRACQMVEADILQMRTELFVRLHRASTGTISELMEWAEELARPQGRDELSLYFCLLRSWYRDLLAALSGGSTEHFVHRDLATHLSEMSKTMSAEKLLVLVTQITEAERSIYEYTANARLVLESLFLRLTDAGFVGVINER